ncbi:hypothetical protein SAMN04515671_3781 [Nakamurella panacisegetis]|uniref:Uncharacterized protein n=1 Tax=Nakamurella panacisegetis TaxID=1090615 RepID=A0A1H0RWI8_9ACTN|nr:hypothetical protein [Nakamurella panacisegetis]SDP33780.1 hypothetical protein SAMN04515671_3781 [Nakamurella panacisegetis]
MTMYLDWTPIDQATIDLAGTDLATAVAGRVPLDGRDTTQVLERVDVSSGWREIYDGPVPEIGHEPNETRPRCLRFAAPAPEGSDGWTSLTFQMQENGEWSTICSPWTAVYEEGA